MRPWRALLVALAVSAAPAALSDEKVDTAKPASAEKQPIDLNTASEHELEQLPGIGQKKAQAILELRRKKPLTRLTQLMQVRGIGKKTLERLKPFVKIEPVPPAKAAAAGGGSVAAAGAGTK